jgi:hypothetical protein
VKQQQRSGNLQAGHSDLCCALQQAAVIASHQNAVFHAMQTGFLEGR